MTAPFLMRPPGKVLGKTAQREWQHLYELLAEVLGAAVELLPESSQLEQTQLSSLAIAFNGQIFSKQADLDLQRWCERCEWRWIQTQPQTQISGREWRWDEHRQLFWVGLNAGDHQTPGQFYAAFADMPPPELVPLTLVHPLLQHLDECFCPLPAGQVLYYPAALSLDARALLAEYVPPADRIEVSYQDALNGACHAVAVGDTLVMHSASSELRHRLNEFGFRVFSSDLTEFEGAASSLCLPLCGVAQPNFSEALEPRTTPQYLF